MRTRLVALSLLVALLVALLLAGCGLVRPDPATWTPDGPLLVAAEVGAECFGPCEFEVRIGADGTVASGEPGATHAVGTIDAASLARLKAAIIETDFAMLRLAHPAGSDCPLFVDGPNLTLTFATPHGPESLERCVTLFDPSWPLFSTLDAALSPHTHLPYLRH